MDLKFVDENHVYLDGKRLHKKRGRLVDFDRHIYYNDKYIVKIDLSGNKQSLIEWKKWNEFYEPHKIFFVPVISFGEINNSDYVIMEIKKFKKNPKPLRHKQMKDFLEVLEFYEIRWDTDIDERTGHMQGCGITTSNQILCYDYGRLVKHF